MFSCTFKHCAPRQKSRSQPAVRTKLSDSQNSRVPSTIEKSKILSEARSEKPDGPASSNPPALAPTTHGRRPRKHVPPLHVPERFGSHEKVAVKKNWQSRKTGSQGKLSAAMALPRTERHNLQHLKRSPTIAIFRRQNIADFEVAFLMNQISN